MTSTFPPTPPQEANADMPAQAMMAAHAPSRNAAPAPKGQHEHIWVITGPAGCGKTSVAEHLHKTYSLPYLEGDSFHTPENVKKMSEGHALTDADRWDWLVLLREQAILSLHSSQSSGVIVTCSALKRKYRDVLRIATYHNPAIQVHFVFLNATEAILMDRVRARQNHYMKDYMVHSQFESLEAPTKDEVDVLSVNAGGTSVEVQKLAVGVFEKVMAADAA